MAIIIIEDVPKNAKDKECKRAKAFSATSCTVIKDKGDTVDLEIVFPDKEKHEDRVARSG